MQAESSPRRTAPTLLTIASVALIADQVTKAAALSALTEGTTRPVIDGVLHWTLQRNPGAAFSLFTRFPVVFTIIATAISVGILVNIRKVPDRLHAIALGLVLGGAVGNLTDRIARPPGVLRGHVIDFIDFRVWPVFNIADSCVVVGALLLVLASWRADKRVRNESADA
jgi:signal peptidase II